MKPIFAYPSSYNILAVMLWQAQNGVNYMKNPVEITNTLSMFTNLSFSEVVVEDESSGVVFSDFN